MTRAHGTSVRLRLTLSYAAFVVVAGVVMFALGLLLLRFVPDGVLTDSQGGWSPDRSDLLAVYLRYAAWGMALLIVVGLVGGWFLAGRMLRPVVRITNAARRVRDGDLAHRIDLPGPSNELSDLADTFDDMLTRIQTSLDEHRRFAANASHELRTPLAVTRTMLEVARADPDRDVDTVLDRVAVMNERSIALTEALLDLASADNVARSLESVDLAALAEVVIDETDDARIIPSLSPTTVRGDSALLRQLITNLVRNAVAYNVPGGSVWVTTSAGLLIVENTGPVVDAAATATLTEPFVRGAGRTRAASEQHAGAGLGLAIVASIARAHDARLEVEPRDGGGLVVRVLFATG